MQHYHNFIDGKFVPSSGTDRIEVTNPSTGRRSAPCRIATGRHGRGHLGGGSGPKRMGQTAAIERAKALRAIAAKIREHVDRSPA